MKTYDPDDTSTQPHAKPCSGCQDNAQNIAAACQILVNAHTMISHMYKELASKAKTPDDQQKFMAEHHKHKSMAEMSGRVVLPD